jgi:very-short-patch-repair endonuclease
MGYSRGRRLTPDTIKEAALKYSTRSEFSKKDLSAYRKAKYLGIIDDVCKHMLEKKYSIPQAMCREIFNQLLATKSMYNTRSIIYPYELDVYYPEYRFAIEYDGAYWHKNNENDVKKDALCKDINIFLLRITQNSHRYEEDIKNQVVQHLSTINNILGKSFSSDDVKEIIIDPSKIYPKDTFYNDIKEAMKNCVSLKDFRDNYTELYNLTTRRGELSLLKHLPRMTRELYPEKIAEIAKTYEKYSDFVDTSDYNAALRHGILKEVSSHMVRDNNRQYSSNELYELVVTTGKKFNRKQDFRVNHNDLYSIALRRGWLDDIFSYSGRKMVVKYSKQDIIDVVKTCKNKTDFIVNKSTYYTEAKKMGIMEELFPQRVYITRLPADMVIERLKKYPNRTALRKNNQALYNRANKLDVLDAVFKPKDA